MSLWKIPILEDLSSILLEKLSEVESSITEIVPYLNHVKNKFRLQSNYKEQAKHVEAKCVNRLDEEKVLKEDAEVKRCRDQRRGYTVILAHTLQALTLQDRTGPDRTGAHIVGSSNTAKYSRKSREFI